MLSHNTITFLTEDDRNFNVDEPSEFKNKFLD